MKCALILIFLSMCALLMVTLIAFSTQAPSRTAAAGGTVDIWLTRGDEKEKLQQQFSVYFSPEPGSNPLRIQVDESKAYQSMDGFGAALTDSAAWLIANTPEPTRTLLMNDLFSSTVGIGISYLRVPMGASEFVKDRWYTYDDIPIGLTDTHLISFSIAHDQEYIIPILLQAKSINPQLKVMASPWSAPAWMKSPVTLTGGSLLTRYHQVYANYVVSFTQAYSQAGIPIDAVTIQNEPLYTSTTYPTMWMDPYQQTEFVKNYVGPAFANAGINTKILVYDHNWDRYDYVLSVLSDTDAKRYVAGSAWHCYTGTPDAQSIVHAAHPDKDIYLTECSGNWSKSQGFAGDLKWGFQKVSIGAVRNWAKTVLYWNLALDKDNGPSKGGCNNDCRGLITIYPTGTVTNAEYYIVGHLSKFVEPGAYRIESDNTHAGSLESVAFLNHDSIVLVVLNPISETQSFNVQWGGQYFSYGLPGQSVATFKWQVHRVYLPLVLRNYRPPVSFQDFEPSNGTPGGYFRNVWHMPCTFEYNFVYQGTRSIRCEAHAAADGTGGNGGTVAIYPSVSNPVDLSSATTFSVMVYDTVGSNTIELKLCEHEGYCSDTIWSPAGSGGTKWTQVTWPLLDFTGVDKSRIQYIELYEWNDGVYYFDDVTLQ